MSPANQNPEQIARDKIDALLGALGSGQLVADNAKDESARGLLEFIQAEKEAPKSKAKKKRRSV